MISSRPPAHGSFAAILDALGALTNAVTVRSLYGDAHPAVARADDAVAAVFTRVLEETPDVLVALADGEFVVCERPAPGLRDRLHVLADAMTRHGIECVVLSRGLIRAECEVLGSALASPAQVAGTVRDRAQASMVHVLLRFLEMGAAGGAATAASGADERYLVPLVREALDGVARALLAGELLDRSPVLDAARAIVSACQSRSFRLEQRSRTGSLEDEAVHATNVALMTAAMALEARYPTPTCVDAAAAALVHDAGFYLVPDAVRHTPAPRLDGEALAAYRRHPEVGATALLLAGCPALWVAAALDHHRGVDGKGFPAVPSGAAPHELVRIVALANFIDRKRTLVDGAADDPVEAVRLAASLEARYFGPPLLRLFTRAFGAHPPGTTVELTNREAALVTRVDPADPRRPQVMLLSGPDAGKRIELRETNLVESRFELSIVRAIPPPLVPRGEPAEARVDDRSESKHAPAIDPEPAIAKPIAVGWRRTSYRPRQEVTTVTRLLEDVLAPAPPSDAPSAAPSSPPAGTRASSPPPVISDRPEAPSDRRFARPVSDLPAPIEKPPPADAAKDLQEQLLAFLADDSPASPTAKGGAVDAALQAFVGGKAPAPSVDKGSLVPVPVASAAVVSKQAGLDPRAGFILMFMDGVTPLAEVIDACGLPAAEATRIVDDLTARGLVELRDRSKRA